MKNTVTSSVSIVILMVFACFADNPLFQTVYTADPAPMVYKDTLFCYTSHDEDVLIDDFFTMIDWLCYSTTDMVNWQSRGRVASLKDFKWTGTNGAWAVQCIPRDGKFYMYCPIHMKGIGVLVANSPIGPFTDPLGKALLNNGGNDIDPTVFIDDDDQAYLYWGNPTCTYAKLNKDMISLMGSRTALGMTVASFGTRTNTERATSYEEGPWFYKRDSLYYLAFAGGPISEHLAYSTSSSPTGPWKYGSVIMSTFSGASFTNHPGIVDYKGGSYLFYHGQQLSNNGFKRSVCVEKFSYNPDGTISKIAATKQGPPQIGTFNPYDTVQAETINFASGVEIGVCSEGGVKVDSINNSDYIKVKGVDFGDGAKLFEARVATASSGAIELRLDSQTGTLVGTCTISGTGDWQTWITKSCTVSGATGKHDLFLKFTGGSGFLFDFNWWKFTADPTGIDRRGSAIPENNAPIKIFIASGASRRLNIEIPQSIAQSTVEVRLFDVAGRVAAMVSNEKNAGSHRVLTASLKGIRSGAYMVKIKVNGTPIAVAGTGLVVVQ